MIRRLIMICVSAMMVANVAVAAGKAKKKKKVKVEAEESSDEEAPARPPYGMAGCGLGSLIISQDSVGGQLGAWLFNGMG